MYGYSGKPDDTLKQDRPNGRKLDLNGTVLKLEDFNGG
jgi:hypothetical protein